LVKVLYLFFWRMFGINTGFLRASKFGARIYRGNLTTKRLPIGWKKGKGVRPMGKMDNKGNFCVDRTKLLKFHVPDLTDFELKPYVSYNSPMIECPPPKIPLEFWQKKTIYLKEMEEEEHLISSFESKMRRLVRVAKFKVVVDSLAKKKKEEREKTN